MSETQLSVEITRQVLEQLDQAMLKIKHCVSQLSNEQIWLKPAGSHNSIGNLVLHLEGNLRQWGIVPFTGAVDSRDREGEFAQTKNFGRDELLEPLQATINECRQLWPELTAERLLEKHSIQNFPVTSCEAILHTTSHFVGHSHQIIMLTRQMLGDDYRFHWTPDLPRDRLPI